MSADSSSEEMRESWDKRWADTGLAPASIDPYPLFADHVDLFPTSGDALEVACGRGRGAVWLASLGLDVWAVDLSPVAIDLATQLAEQCGVADRCRFEAHDLETGLPEGDLVDVVVCYLFREADLDRQMMDRLKPGGLLAVVVLSEVGHGPGRFRAKPGELTDAFAELDLLEAGEADGNAWFLGRKPAAASTP